MRIWQSGNDDGGIHVMGNGELVVYGRGPEISNFYGPPYSSPNILTLAVEGEGAIADEAEREPGMAIWRHHTTLGGHLAMEFIEYAVAGISAYIRQVSCVLSGVSWIIRPHPASLLLKMPEMSSAWLLVLHPGQAIMSYPTSLWAYHIILAQGNCDAVLDGTGGLVVRLLPGESRLIVTGAAEYPSCRRLAEEAAVVTPDSWLNQTRAAWRSFTRRRLATSPLQKRFPPKIAFALDGISCLIAAQQSTDGGIMAGHNYALAYIRDQYGATRGLLALGLFEEARRNLLFRKHKFERFGTLQTAEAMGTDCVRHIHENDEVEGPAYTILQARDYLVSTGDQAFVASLRSMLFWCWDVQQKHLADGLLPFNGDETYIAGGFFPRSGLLHGSADATLLFIEAGRWLSDWAVSQDLWSTEEAERARAVVDEAREAYRRYLWDADKLWANAPDREDWVTPPRFRHGVCEGSCSWFGWIERTRTGRYACVRCYNRGDLPPERPERREVNSVSLLPVYLGSDILSRVELKNLADRVLAQERLSGHIPSVRDSEGCVGYDPGLILLNLILLGHPSTDRAYERLVRMLDGTGAWNEYYDGDDRPRSGCCRARPWESGINAAAIAAYWLDN